MTQPIDTAYVEIKAKGEDDAAREIAKALDKIAAEVKKLTKVIEKEFVQAGQEMESEVQQATKSIERDLAKQAHAAEKTGTSLALAMKEASSSAARSIDDMADEAVHDLERVSRQAVKTAATVALAGRSGGGGGGGDGVNIDVGRNRDLNAISGGLRGLRDLAGAAMGAVRTLASELSDSLAQGATKAGQALGSLVGIIGSVLGPIFSLISSLGILGVALLLTPIIIPLIAALSQLAGLFALLPGSIGVLAAAIAPLVIAFQGIGDAVSALASGDLEKIDRAMQNLAPNARKFAVEMFKLKDSLKGIKWAVQTAFFEQFNGALTKLVNNLLPVLTTGLSDVSGALGNLGARLAEVFGGTDAIVAFRAIFDTTTTAIVEMTAPLMDLFTSIFRAIKASQPFLDRMFKGLAGGVQKFADWLSKAVEDGRFQKWLEDAFDMAKQLWGLLKAVGELIGAVFDDSADEGQSIIESITESIKELTEYLKSEEGKKQLADMAQAGKDLANALITITNWFTRLQGIVSGVWNSPLALLIPINVVGRFKFFKGLWDSFWPKLKEFGSSVGGWFKDAGKSIGDFFGDVGQWFKDTWTTITEKGGEILQWFQDLPGKIGEFMSQVPGKIKDAFVTAFDNATYAIGFGIGAVVKYFIDLPGNIGSALTTLWNTVTDWFGRTRDSVVTTVTNLWNDVVDWFERLPSRVSSAVSTIVDNVTKWFRSTRERVTTTVSNTVDSVVEWFRKLPGRAADVISDLPDRIWKILRRIVSDARDIGSDIMDGIADGIRNGWNAAIEAAKRAAKNILQGFWDALGIHSPSRVMALEVGKPIMQGIGVGVEDNTPDVTRSINLAVNRTVTDTSANAAMAGATASGGTLTIQNLTIPITGTFDFTNPAGARAVAMQIYKALEELKRGYR